MPEGSLALVAPTSSLRRRHQAYAELRGTLPVDVADALAVFRTHQWPLLEFLAYDPGARDLVERDPVLSYLLAQQLGGDVRRIRRERLGGWKRRLLAAWLGLPPDEATVRILRRVEPRAVDGETRLDLLRLFANTESAARLRHVHRVNRGVLDLLADPELASHATPVLLEEVGEDWGERHHPVTARRLWEILRMQEALPERAKVHLYTSRARVAEVHGLLVERYTRYVEAVRAVRHVDVRNFRHPPLPGLPGQIEPLDSPRELLDESVTQRNCVDTYVDRVVGGRFYIYRVHHHERATLSITQDADGFWSLSELSGYANRPVRRDTLQVVLSWLGRHRICL